MSVTDVVRQFEVNFRTFRERIKLKAKYCNITLLLQIYFITVKFIIYIRKQDVIVCIY